jgi:hypothetical protein
LVAGGHLTPIPNDSVYSGVISLRSLRLLIFLAELNGLQLWGADVSSAYLEADTKEKVCFIAGDEFGKLRGHTLVVCKALYGLRSSGLRWHEKFADILRELNFLPSRAEPDIWMRQNNDLYEYIGVYVDDLAIAAKDPGSIIKILEGGYKLGFKGVGPLKFHLGCDFNRDKDGVLYYGPKSYIEKMVSNYERIFGAKPREFSSPLEKGDHPELDESELLNFNDTRQYQSMIGATQWAIALGRFDVMTAIMTMSHFRIAPRQGHLDRMKRIYGYLRRFKEGAIRVRTSEPDLSPYPKIDHNWLHSVYGEIVEEIPCDIPEPLGKSVILTHYADANLYHDMVNGRAVTGILHFINNTPIDWYSKRQSTVENATYGAEFVAARIATDQIIDLRMTLRYFGVPIQGKSHLFGDNASVVMNATIPHSSLKKRHNALSFHRVREAIAAGIMYLHKINGKLNPSDVVSKHCGYSDAWPLLGPLLFWKGTVDDWQQHIPRANGECKDDEKRKSEEKEKLD